MKKLMRTIAVLLAAVMVFGMTVFAASPQTDNGAGDQSLADTLFLQYQNSTVTGDGDVTFGPCGVDIIALAKEYMQKNGLTGDIITALDINAGAHKNLKVSGYYIDANASYYMLHYFGSLATPNVDQFEQIATKTNGNAVEFTTTEKTSPFVLVKGTAPAAAAVVAPKTGEVIAISAILALIMMAGAVVCAKKARLQK